MFLHGFWVGGLLKSSNANFNAEFSAGMKAIVDIGKQGLDIGRHVAFLVPLVCDMVIEANNLWTNTQMADSTSDREDNFRANLIKKLGYKSSGGRKKKRILYTCMASGVEGDNNEIEAAHIVPAKSVIKRLSSIGMNEDDVNSVRNGLLLASGIHKAFDNLRISFVKSNPLSECLYMKIWDRTCCDLPVFPGSTKTIGEFDEGKLNLGGHDPFKRALSFQSYMAFLKHKHIPENLEPVEYGSENESTYFKERKLMKEAVIRDMRVEVEEEE